MANQENINVVIQRDFNGRASFLVSLGLRVFKGAPSLSSGAIFKVASPIQSPWILNMGGFFNFPLEIHCTSLLPKLPYKWNQMDRVYFMSMNQ